jgi:uncharacterized repeat protein (TIGR01451 family)
MQRLPLCLAFATALAAAPAFANIYTVGSGTACTHATIQSAIDAADAASSNVADEIRLSGASFTGQQLTIAVEAAHGALAINGGFATCTSPNPTPGVRTVVSGPSQLNGNPVMQVADTADLTLRNLEISDGYVGGLVLETGAGTATSRITLDNTHVVHNSATEGGGIRLANYNTATMPERLSLQLIGNSIVGFNNASVRGGGIACSNARLEMRNYATVRENRVGVAGFAGSLDGGGIHAVDCELDISAIGPAGLGALYSNTAALQGRGGGLYLTGVRARADFYPVVAGESVVVHGNRAREGGGIAVADGARLNMYGNSFLLDNLADVAGGALWVMPGGAAGIDTRVLMQSTLEGAPEDATTCPNPEQCAGIFFNRAINNSGDAMPGAVLQVAAGGAGTAQVDLRGVRIMSNRGLSLVSQESAPSRVSINGSLIAENRIDGGFGAFVSQSASNALVLSASSVANNLFMNPSSTVFGTGTTCAPQDDAVGVHLRRSIIWQPGHSLLFTLFDPPQASCFTHLIANDFGWLGTAPDRLAIDPQFVNVSTGEYHLASTSPALDFAPAFPDDVVLGLGPRAINLPAVSDRFGPQDLGAFEQSFLTTVTAGLGTSGGSVNPPAQSVPYGQTASIVVSPASGWSAVMPPAGDCPIGSFSAPTYTTGAVQASCNVVVSFIHQTNLNLGVSANPAVFGQTLIISANLVDGVSPTGNITFRDGANVLGTAPISGLSASIATDALEPGTHVLTAEYAGDALNTPDTSQVINLVVNRAATTTTVPPIPAIRFGQSANVVATLGVTAPGNGTPTGTITVTGGSDTCTITLPATTCVLTPATFSANVEVTASYAGDARFQASSGTQMLQVIPQYVGGTLSGVDATGLVLQLGTNGTPAGTYGVPQGATGFAFATAVAVGANYAVSVQSQPSGLFCTVSNGSGSMPAEDVGNVAVACSNAPHAVLSGSIDNGQNFVRYGQTVVYTAIVRNTGTAAANDVPVAGAVSAALDGAASTWSCTVQGGASCGNAGSGGFNDSVDLPIGGQVTYTVQVPVRAVTPETLASFGFSANAGEISVVDTDIIVLFRDGFEAD